ncbi:mitochondrial protein Pet127-domain-containing protein [Bisporella sp. PMI_857]|nr:mitochondrial protein Pet127-domain-containing protein [Bisporella sp. PMI_857]
MSKAEKDGGNAIQTLSPDDLILTPVEKAQPPVPRLAHGLERVLFNPGVYHLQDPRSRVFNFDPYLQKPMPVEDFDFNALKQYITSSKDTTLLSIVKEEKKKYTGSTSSMSAALAHFHFLLSQWRPINPGMLSQNFPVEYHSFTSIQRGPSAIFLRYKDGVYAIDADKEFDTSNILALLGKSLEKFLTLPKEHFEKYRKENSGQLTEGDRNDPETFHYSTLGDFLLRSQLDAYDPRVPGTGMFDLKTRAVVSIRMDVEEYKEGMGYEIKGRHGEWQSFEREYYDMIRAAFLKYSLQVRMGRMDGIFVAFHNIERIFGFQYISLPEMDYALHGTEDTTIGDNEFKLSLDLMNKILDRATEKFPQKSLRLHYETRVANSPFMYIFAEPFEDDEIESIQSTNRAKIEKFEREVLSLTEIDSEDSLEEKKDAEWQDDSIGLGSLGIEVSKNHISPEVESVTDAPLVSPEKPLLAMILVIRNLVDGEYVERPEDLERGAKKWTIEYSLTEIASGDRARTLYNACKRRRYDSLHQMKKEDAKWTGKYVERLRELSKQGRQWRNKQDRKEAKTGQVFLDDELTRNESYGSS